MSPIIATALEKYALYHQNKRNEVVHAVGIPLIVIGFGIFLTSLLSLFPMLILLIVYAGFCREPRITLPLSVLVFAGIALGLMLPWWVGLMVLFFSLAGQVVSHRIFEKGTGKNPAFFTNLKLTLVAPIWWARYISQPRA